MTVKSFVVEAPGGKQGRIYPKARNYGKPTTKRYIIQSSQPWNILLDLGF